MNINMGDFKAIKDFCHQNKFIFHVSPLIFSKTDGNEAPKELRIAKDDLSLILKEIDEITRHRHIHKYECDRCPGMALLDGNSVFSCDTFAKSCAEIRLSNYC
ncbi:hypothetical protein GCM10010912_50000 [Paenibacillus albidus]|uniref:Uncharacterized protein n=1 Tax=Paenibacillus albidus TaxID=2041023 RepID=A0A917FRC0_9BACL|nr:hypothetical protein [Paenibacillus albidus]GGF99226.1 hypothetical protein GCM10010912_50000 [Paenibacillus albidus]